MRRLPTVACITPSSLAAAVLVVCFGLARWPCAAARRALAGPALQREPAFSRTVCKKPAGMPAYFFQQPEVEADELRPCTQGPRACVSSCSSTSTLRWERASTIFVKPSQYDQARPRERAPVGPP